MFLTSPSPAQSPVLLFGNGEHMAKCASGPKSVLYTRLPWLLWSIRAGFSSFSTRLSFSFMERLNWSRGQGLREARWDIFGLVEELNSKRGCENPKSPKRKSSFASTGIYDILKYSKPNKQTNKQICISNYLYFWRFLEKTFFKYITNHIFFNNSEWCIIYQFRT